MGKLKDNLMMDTVGGKVGKQVVFRNFRGKTVVSGRPKPRTKTFTTKQVGIQRKFTAAAAYANSVLQDAVMKPLYEARIGGTNYTARAVAMSDYLTPPTVESIDLSKYKGAVNDVISVTAIDDFKVTKVEVVILSAAGQQLEAGNAVQDKFDGTKWRYTATVANASLAGTQVSVTAYDTPGNEGTLSKAV
jgi:hypothetical protein